MKRRGKTSAGLTLVELSIAMAIGSVMLVVVSSLLARLAAFHRVDEQVRVLEEARQGFFTMAEEIRVAREVRIQDVHASSMTFTVYKYQLAQPLTQFSTATVRYRFVPPTGAIGNILREEFAPLPGSSRVLMRNVVRPGSEVPQTSLLFSSATVQDINILVMDLQVTVRDQAVPQLQQSARTFRTRVFLRNPPPSGT